MNHDNDNFIEADIIFIVLGSGENNKNFALKIARSAKLNGILTLVIPVNAQEINNNDIQEFKNYSDSVILPLMNKSDASIIVENIIYSIIKTGFINIDLADVKYILYNTGTAFYGSLCISGHDKISTVNSKILSMCENIRGSRNILMNFITGANITLGEMLEITKIFESLISPDSLFIWGHSLDELINYHDERETLEILDIIFQAGINLSDDEGRTPLMYIDYNNDNECTEKLRLLIEHGADLNKKNNEGKNAFIYAAKNIYYRPEIVKIFRDSGIDINSQDNNGRDALEIMNLQNNDSRKQEIFYREVLPLMIKSGADSKFYEYESLRI